ncbi:unnamed protein product, partial [Oppiella nova]
MIEANVDVRTTDGYLLRVFVIGFTKRQPNQVKKTSYAQYMQSKRIRKVMTDIIQDMVQCKELKDVVRDLIPDSFATEIEKACHWIYPLHDVMVRKVKVLKKPKFDLGKLMDLYGETNDTTTTIRAPTDEPMR